MEEFRSLTFVLQNPLYCFPRRPMALAHEKLVPDAAAATWLGFSCSTRPSLDKPSYSKAIGSLSSYRFTDSVASLKTVAPVCCLSSSTLTKFETTIVALHR